MAAKEKTSSKSPSTATTAIAGAEAAAKAEPKPRRSKPRCSQISCRRVIEKQTSYCIFHLGALEKEEPGLWEKCMQRFYMLLNKGEGEFGGYVLKDLDLAGRTISQEVDFNGAQFYGDSRFSAAEGGTTEFQKEADFSRAVFHGPVGFQAVRFLGPVSFTKARFKAGADFSRGIFTTHSEFLDSQFEGPADLSETSFNEHANFRAAAFNQPSLFKGAYFEKGGSFDLVKLNEADFEDASLEKVSFRQVNLDHVKFAGAQMENAYLADSWWSVAPDRNRLQKVIDEISVADPRFVIREEEEARQIPDDNRKQKVQALLKAESTYRRLKHTHTNEGDYNKAGEFYIHEMRIKRTRYQLQTGLRAKWKLFWNSFYNLSCGYGERPKRLVVNALLVILTFALLYYAFDGIGRGGAEDYDPTFKESLYFSVVTFTTLGYGDYSPKAAYQLIITLEAFIGAFTIALSVLVFGRKVMR